MFLIVTIRIARRKGFIVCEAEYLLPLQKHVTMRTLGTLEHILPESRRRKHRKDCFGLRSA